MKKLLMLLLTLGVLFSLTACEPEDPLENFLPGMEEGNPNTFFRFKALDGGADFGIHLINPLPYFRNAETKKEYYAMPGFSKRRAAIAFTRYSNFNGLNEAHAKAFSKLVENYQNSGIEFAIIFIDPNFTDEQWNNPSDEMKWIREIPNVRMFYDPYPDPSGVVYNHIGNNVLFRPETGTGQASPFLPYTYYVAHDKVYKYPETRFGTAGLSESFLEENYYNDMDRNINKFIEDADNGI